jgi:membrane protein implicated in regulation of membrane protease activity
MAERRSKLQGRSELGVVAGWLATAAALLVALLSEGTLRLAAFAALGVLVLWFLAGDFFLALADERAAARNPHDNRVSDVGRRVRVVEDFSDGPGGSLGKVSLAGEIWKARSVDGGRYKAGDELVVVAVERLVLVVAPAGRQ